MRCHGLMVLVGLILALAMQGCMTVHSISTNQIPEQSQRRQWITARDSALIILGIPFGSVFVSEAQEAFVAKCPTGAIEGVLTKYQTTGYPFFSIAEVKLEGYCLKGLKKGRV